MIAKQIDNLFSLWQEGLCPGGQVLVRQKGEIIYDRTFGYADVEKRIPMTHDHVFHVASISKQFTAMAILLLWEDGKLSLDADIREYIPDLVAFSEPMPLWTLLHQVSGLRDMLELLDKRRQQLKGDALEDMTVRYASSGWWSLWIFWHRSSVGSAVITGERKNKDKERIHY